MITFEKLCPVWNKAINQEGMKLFGKKLYGDCNFICDEKKINIHDASSCIVGEAHGWDSEYMVIYDSKKSCVGCTMFSENFALVDNMENLIRFKDNFVNHWDLDHGK